MKASELASRLQADLVGDPEVDITGVAPLESADQNELSFLSNPKYREAAKTSHAGALLCSSGDNWGGRTVLVCPNPYAAFAKAIGLFHPPCEGDHKIHPTAVLGEGSDIAPGVSIGPYSIIGRGTTIGSGTQISALTAVGDGCTIGNDCILHPRVTLYGGTVLGDRVILHSGCVIGSDGFGYATDRGNHIKVPQVGRVVIESDVEIGANATVDRGTLSETRIGEGTKIDNLVQVGHNVKVGARSILVAQSGISGSTTLGSSCVLAGQAGIVGHVHLGSGVRIGAKSAVTKDLPDGSFVTGYPARDHREWLKERALSGRLGELLRRLRAIEIRTDVEGKEEPR